ncbi:hypothetical protein V6N12_045254 [Hibiscus sabdariffa]|uniref:Retrotransposon gag domain-containing protein n=1 Tax=Hibiscus sabdariffa TaxID=183260 RepID=A0ABR2G343_9ROSI
MSPEEEPERTCRFGTRNQSTSEKNSRSNTSGKKRKNQREQADSEGTTSTTNEESTDSSHHPANTAPTHITETTHTPMADQTISELAAAPAVQQPLCITFPQGEMPFQLKTSLIHLLPTFHGLPSESPHKHLTEFHLVYSSMKPRGVSEHQIKLRAFPFSLSSIAKEWLFYLPPNSITTWTDSIVNFLAGKSNSARACGICTMTDHPTDYCPNPQEETINVVGNFPGPPQRPYNPHRKLPSQTETNPKENVSTITLKSGTIVEPPIQKQEEAKKPTSLDSQEEDDATTKKGSPTPEPEQSPYAKPPPFPLRFLKKDKQAEEKEILDIFRKVEVNIPLLEVIRKIPRYARFLKDLCTNKRKLVGHEKINLGENVSAILTQHLPPTLKDQGMFTIPCKIGKVGIKRAMCDLGASINVMPFSVYKTLSADPLKETRVTVQLADRSIIYPKGVLENVLV